MAIADLMKILSRPVKPVEAGSSSDWLEIEQDLGINLPQDYKDFINAYGSGQVAEFLWIYNPFSKEYQDSISTALDWVREEREDWDEEFQGPFPYSIYPDHGGLFPWGRIDNADCLYWQTKGEPDKWTVVVYEPRGIKFEHFEESMTSFLIKLLSERIRTRILPTDLGHNRVFRVYESDSS
jgi:hypothetical protein